MSETTIWMLLGLVLVGVELITGTFFFLLLSVGGFGAAMAANLGLSITAQITTFALGCLPALAFLALKKRRPSNPELINNMDIGAVVQVSEWDEAGRALVMHRGAQWAAIKITSTPNTVGAHIIVGTKGNSLIIEKV